MIFTCVFHVLDNVRDAIGINIASTLTQNFYRKKIE